MGKNMSFWPLVMAKIFFWPDMRFELGTPELEYRKPKRLFYNTKLASMGYECTQLIRSGLLERTHFETFFLSHREVSK